MPFYITDIVYHKDVLQVFAEYSSGKTLETQMPADATKEEILERLAVYDEMEDNTPQHVLAIMSELVYYDSAKGKVEKRPDPPKATPDPVVVEIPPPIEEPAP